jgi:ABC-2 type transport system ATP-binding protein
VAHLGAVANALAGAGIAVEDLGLRQPTLDEVFLTLTGATPASPDGDLTEPDGRPGAPPTDRTPPFDTVDGRYPHDDRTHQEVAR